MIPSRTRIAFLFRRWYWNRPYTTRLFLNQLPSITVAVLLGLIIGVLAGAGF